MPDDSVRIPRHRHEDEYAWLRAQAVALDAGRPDHFDPLAVSAYLHEAAETMIAAVRSQLVNLMAHACKVALTRNPHVVAHWRSELTNFHDEVQSLYRPSMAQHLSLDPLWRRARRKVIASFRDHGEPLPDLPDPCPFRVDRLLDPDLDIDALVDDLRKALNPEAGPDGGAASD